MKANELKLNNYIQDRFGKQVWVYQLSNLGDENIINEESYPPYYKPIPITQEWLFKLGFQDDDVIEEGFIMGYYLIYTDLENDENEFALIQGEEGYYLAEEREECWLTAFTSPKPFQYIHEIQNAFFLLTGIELKIKK
jgi:hypothetical protein